YAHACTLVICSYMYLYSGDMLIYTLVICSYMYTYSGDMLIYVHVLW
ncbi:uncharacterized protein, partial [Watersipora subatra]